jgi:hypothetical protein
MVLWAVSEEGNRTSVGCEQKRGEERGVVEIALGDNSTAVGQDQVLEDLDVEILESTTEYVDHHVHPASYAQLRQTVG